MRYVRTCPFRRSNADMFVIADSKGWHESLKSKEEKERREEEEGKRTEGGEGGPLTMKRALRCAASSAASNVSPPTLSQNLPPHQPPPKQPQTETGRNKHAHVDPALALEHGARVLGLVVEHDVRAERAHERELLRGARARDHSQPGRLCELDDRPDNHTSASIHIGREEAWLRTRQQGLQQQ